MTITTIQARRYLKEIAETTTNNEFEVLMAVAKQHERSKTDRMISKIIGKVRADNAPVVPGASADEIAHLKTCEDKVLREKLVSLVETTAVRGYNRTMVLEKVRL